MVLANRGEVPVGMDSMVTSTVNLIHVSSSVFGDGSLVKPCREDVAKVCPALAERWEARNDFAEWEFKIRDGVLWHDGTPMTAEDLKFWMDLAYNGVKGDKTRAPARYRTNFGPLNKVELLDQNRLRVTLDRRTAFLPDLMGLEQAVKVTHPRHLMQKKIEQGEPGASPQDLGFVGMGPFKLDKFDAATLVQVRRFDKYWEKDQGGRQMPYLDGIDFVVIKDATAMDAAFRTGRLDGTSKGLGHVLSPERKKTIEQALGDKVWFGEVGVTAMSVNFNVLRSGPWADARVRRAFALWLDKEQAIKAVSLGSGELHTGLSDPWRHPDWKSLPGFDISPQGRERAKAEAKRLLAEAGYANGWQEANYTCRKQWFVACEFVQAQLAALGIEAPIKFLDEAQWPLNLRQGDYNITNGGYDALMPENLDIRRATQSPASYTKHEDPAIDAFYARLGDATAQEQRVATYRELERYVLQEQAYVIPLLKEIGYLAYRSHVKNLPVAKLEYNFNNDFATTWLDK